MAREAVTQTVCRRFLDAREVYQRKTEGDRLVEPETIELSVNIAKATIVLSVVVAITVAGEATASKSELCIVSPVLAKLASLAILLQDIQKLGKQGDLHPQ